MSVKKEPVPVSIPAEPVAAIPSISAEEQEKARKEAIQRFTELRRAFAWSVHRVPLEKSFASAILSKTIGKIALPKSYRSLDGCDIQTVHADDDLNMVVYNWYEQLVTSQEGMEKRKGVNYVAQDNILSRRHEFLGPDPRVAGFEFGKDGKIHIRWWDAFLEDPWLLKEKWKIELVADVNGQWVEA